jgi:hypothetical protein
VWKNRDIPAGMGSKYLAFDRSVPATCRKPDSLFFLPVHKTTQHPLLCLGLENYLNGYGPFEGIDQGCRFAAIGKLVSYAPVRTEALDGSDIFYSIETTYGHGAVSSDRTDVYAHLVNGGKFQRILVLSGLYLDISTVQWQSPLELRR